MLVKWQELMLFQSTVKYLGNYNIRQKMKKARNKPDAENHHQIRISSAFVDINFRYFSPTKTHESESVASEDRPPTIISIPDRSTYQDLTHIRDERLLDPVKVSDKFYEDGIEENRYSILHYYEKLQSRLLDRHNRTKKASNITRLQISEQTKRSLSKSKPGQLKRPKATNRKSFLKRFNIDGLKQLSPSKGQKPLTSARESAQVKKHRINIFEEQNKENQPQYITPRNSTRKKGIRVFSSASTAKERDDCCSQMQKSNPKIQGRWSALKPQSQNQPRSMSAKLTKAKQKNKKDKNVRQRIFSKQKLPASHKPATNIYERRK